MLRVTIHGAGRAPSCTAFETIKWREQADDMRGRWKYK